MNASEQEQLDKIAARKKGTLIKVTCWTDETRSSSETHAKSLSAAIKLIKRNSIFYANWKLEFVSEVKIKQPINIC